MKHASKIYTALVMLFLFAPIAILVVFSFNEAKSLSVFSGFSFHWYRELLRDNETLISVRNTLLLAVSAALISTVMGTAAAVGMNSLRRKYLRAALDSVTNIPMINPDIITGISLMLMFVYVGRMFGMATSLNFGTLLIAHATFCLPYVILQVLPKLQQMDKALPEAAMDLGCTPLQAFLQVEVPEIMPGIITGMIMAFTMSLDDFVISYFTTGNGFQTLPIRIYNMTKKTVTPKMYALATIIFFVILTMLLVTNLRGDEDSRELKRRRRAARAAAKTEKKLKKEGNEK
ncbi:MAG: ABC transporter permease [Oscillospiraceae bacterium]|nr:ABC transporter permease [Oscillospiraceae bacterium]